MGEARTDEVFDGEPGGAANSRIESLFREHNDTLLRFLRARLHSEADAREAAQEAYVQIALSELPPRCREAFLLSRREGWASGRIAAHLGVSDRMVRLYLVRALEHLEAAL